jgi:putative hydrolase of the HAD superfamily
MSRWRAIVFDLDDTLYPERDYVRGGFVAAAEWAASELYEERQVVFDELWASFEAGVRGDTFDRWLERHGHAGEVNRLAMIAAYRGHLPQLEPYEDVLPALEGLRGTVLLGLITEGARAVQEAKLASLALRQAFDKVLLLGEDERDEWKPSPAPFERWLMGTGIAPAEAIYIGDNPAKDFLGARRAGWSSIRVRRPDGLHRDEEPFAPEAAPDFEIVNLQSLVASFQSPVSSLRSSAPRRRVPRP